MWEKSKRIKKLELQILNLQNNYETQLKCQEKKLNALAKYLKVSFVCLQLVKEQEWEVIKQKKESCTSQLEQAKMYQQQTAASMGMHAYNPYGYNPYTYFGRML